LIGWYNAGTDDGVAAPELFGCAQLPDPVQCFGAAESLYGESQRDTLFSILMNEKLQTMPWPKSLRSSFSFPMSTSSKSLYGSPMLDVALGQVDAVLKVLRELKYVTNMKKQSHQEKELSSVSKKSGSGKKQGGKGKKSKLSFEEATQFDNILPPELPTSWVQCELCKKWRRVAWHVDPETLPELWECPLNTWDIDNATCDAPQDSYDPSKENTVDYKSELTQNTLETSNINEWRDVYCVKNLVYYEAQIKKIKVPKKANDKAKILFHYKGWSPKFDEWIVYDSERIQPHHLFTNPDATDPRQQESWQGLSPVKATIRSAISMPSKKRLSGNHSENGSSSKKRRNVESSNDDDDEEMEILS
jgi:hypothetical protein